MFDATFPKNREKWSQIRRIDSTSTTAAASGSETLGLVERRWKKELGNQLIRPWWNRRDGRNKFVPRSHRVRPPAEHKVCHRRRCESCGTIVAGKVLVFVRLHDRSSEYIGVTWRRDACKKGDTKYHVEHVSCLLPPPSHTLAYFSDRERERERERESDCAPRTRSRNRERERERERACARVCTYLRRCLVTVFKDVSHDLVRLGDWSSFAFLFFFFWGRYWIFLNKETTKLVDSFVYNRLKVAWLLNICITMDLRPRYFDHQTLIVTVLYFLSDRKLKFCSRCVIHALLLACDKWNRCLSWFWFSDIQMHHYHISSTLFKRFNIHTLKLR